MPEEFLKPVVRSLVSLLVRGEYAAVVAACQHSRLSPKDLAGVVKEYGRQLIEPPESGWIIGVVAVRDVALPTWSADVPLFTRDEGRSDLTLQMTVVRDGDQWNVELDDLHVL